MKSESILFVLLKPLDQVFQNPDGDGYDTIVVDLLDFCDYYLVHRNTRCVRVGTDERSYKHSVLDPHAQAQVHIALLLISRLGDEATATEGNKEKSVGEQAIVTLVPVDQRIVTPVVSVEEAKAMWKLFQELKGAILTPSDYVTLRMKRRDGSFTEKDMIIKSGWRKLATAFGLTDEILVDERWVDPDDPKHIVWRVRVRISAPRTGRFTEAVGSASSREREFAHMEHDLRAQAHTRAKSRGISDLIGGGEDVGDDVIDQPDVENKPAGAPKGATGTASGPRKQQVSEQRPGPQSGSGTRSGPVGGSASSSPPTQPQEQPKSARYSEAYGADCPKCKKPLILSHAENGNTYVRCENCGVIEKDKVPPKKTVEQSTMG